MGRNNLINFIEKNLGKKYKWGEVDCCMLVLIYLGIEKPHYRKYKTLRGAMSYYKKQPHNYNVWLNNNGYYGIQRNFEQDGDIILVEDKPFDILGIHYQRKYLVANHIQGVILEKLPSKYSCFRKVKHGQ